MNRELPVVHEERLSVITVLEPVHGLLSHAVLDMFPGFAIQVGDGPGSQVGAAGAGAVVVGNIDVEAKLESRVRAVSKVPFTEVGGGVASLLQQFAEGGHGRVESGGGLDNVALLVGGTTRPRGGGVANFLGMAPRRGEAGSSRVLSAQNTGAGGGAEWVGGIRIVKRHSACGETLQVGRFVKLGFSVEGGVGPSQIIREDEDDVRAICCLPDGGKQK